MNEKWKHNKETHYRGIKRVPSTEKSKEKCYQKENENNEVIFKILYIKIKSFAQKYHIKYQSKNTRVEQNM
jgi:hypothetical protein